MTRRLVPPLLLVPVLVVAVVLGVHLLSNQPWQEGSRHGPWVTVFTGYGRVQGADDELELAPRPATSAERTHAALVVGATARADVALSVDVRTDSQLRRGDPNAWEVGWVLWHYSSPSHFYALALKPNGWELSKQDPAAPGGQKFLASGTTPVFPVRTEYRVSVVQVGPVIKVSADGRMLTAYTDVDKPYLAGRVGFYTEDAKVTFRNIRVTDIPPSTQGSHS